ncbi:MAG: TlpA family protein disulfide reductase [Candidatus Angelobacter sp. Gp1-AA117]|nr:MAG: TlpA family protein disulfide reductase [Candidatus Angelobacter sp. Gp1-AA117]
MPALPSGVAAPEVNLSTVDGKEFSLEQARKRGPVVLAFFKVNCPVCQMAFPYLERIYKAYSGSPNVTLVGVSQNDAKETKAFNRDYGVTFPVLLDPTGKYPVSNAYGLTNVPSVFLVSPEGDIELSIVSWSKPDMEELNRRLAKASGKAPAQIFTPGDKVADFKPG